uniref:Uncharacterized protein n=1 Tax=Denticeps clupeoides TaxID=299321 RepID=A0AAY4DJH5_9TELE
PVPSNTVVIPPAVTARLFTYLHPLPRSSESSPDLAGTAALSRSSSRAPASFSRVRLRCRTGRYYGYGGHRPKLSNGIRLSLRTD